MGVWGPGLDLDEGRRSTTGAQFAGRVPWLALDHVRGSSLAVYAHGLATLGDGLPAKSALDPSRRV